ncbi:hypothetical protein FRACYDRAFT_248546 [Fragilariopsis cylindrus CCMP1102]|uniref:Uncharacterized protein n=1 Tax=Fragilariopsis cylindrus CCMP1102 TaxID=635003 RepID=A0A1E7ETL1_9STRA|nr:hypothetical protein FRACYDRAFT_248546 [Fragilariopsis cylindrus CCMP1102]|eukprot:OEU09212.1 hypothetical protein FRACYDRAFT_248546 [Fragilariopsis cylindrus CCMP1102]
MVDGFSPAVIRIKTSATTRIASHDRSSAFWANYYNRNIIGGRRHRHRHRHFRLEEDPWSLLSFSLSSNSNENENDDIDTDTDIGIDNNIISHQRIRQEDSQWYKEYVLKILGNDYCNERWPKTNPKTKIKIMSSQSSDKENSQLQLQLESELELESASSQQQSESQQQQQQQQQLPSITTTDDVDVDVNNGVDNVVDDMLKQAFSLSEDEDGGNIDDDYSQNKNKKDPNMIGLVEESPQIIKQSTKTNKDEGTEDEIDVDVDVDIENNDSSASVEVDDKDGENDDVDDVVDDILKQAFSLSEDEDGSNIDDDNESQRQRRRQPSLEPSPRRRGEERSRSRQRQRDPNLLVDDSDGDSKEIPPSQRRSSRRIERNSRGPPSGN